MKHAPARLFAAAIVLTASLAEADTLDTWTTQVVGGGGGVSFWKDHFTTGTYSSTDGVTWTATPSPTMVHVSELNGVLVATEKQGLFLSKDGGASWVEQNAIPKVPLSARHVAFGNNVFVATLDPATAYVTYPGSMPQSFWRQTATPNGAFYDVVFANGQFVAVGPKGVSSSTDGAQWTARGSSTTSLNAIAQGGGRWVAVGVNVAATSTDGVAWTTTALPANLVAVAYGGGRFVAAGIGASPNAPYVASSADGTTWTTHRAVGGSVDRTSNLAYGKNRFVLSGGGSVFTSAWEGRLPVVTSPMAPVLK